MADQTETLRILIVEDSAEDRTLYRRFLNRDPNQSYEFVETDSGTEALRLCQREKVDCILLDYRLPDMDGLEVLRTLAAGRGITPAPVIMLTGFGSERVDQKAMQEGAQDYLVKGQITELVLRRTIRHAMERYRLLAALREKEAQTRTILSAAADGIVTFDEEGRIESLNPAAERMFGCRRIELLGQRIQELIPELQSQVGDIPAPREFTARRRDGTSFPAEVMTSLAAAGRRCFFTAIVRDVTERKYADERFRLAIKASPTAMVVVDRDGLITLVNSRTEEMFGYRAEELLGKPVEFLLPERFRTRHAGERETFFDRGEARALDARRDLVARRKDGGEFPVEIGLNPFTTTGGNFVLASVVDVTERRQAEDQHKLFLAATSHDIRNSLGAILGYAEMLGGRADDPTARSVTARINTLVKTLSGMMEDIVVFANTETRDQLCFAPIAGDDIIAECAHFIEKPCAAAGLRLDVAYPGPCVVETDRGKLARICQNLLSNAVRYTKEGAVHLRGEATGDGLRITVADTGVGIPAEAMDRIFEPYYRHPGAQEIEPLGTGLGLATVKRFSELLGATVSVESREGSGTTFTVFVPARPPREG